MFDAPHAAAAIDETAIDRLFVSARSYKGWRDTPVPDATIVRLYDILRYGPTSTNCSPARFVFVRTPEGKERLLPCLDAGNVEKARTAPVVAIVATDARFWERLDVLFPHRDVRPKYRDDEAFAAETAFRNASLQAAYLILAARALGLDCGPMSGFDNAAVDREFFAGTRVRSNFLVNLGYGDPASLFPRSPRLSFDEACSLA